VAGEKVSSLSKEVGVSEGTISLWKRRALIGAGWAEGVKSWAPFQWRALDRCTTVTAVLP
jgi:hypothetical protein